MNVSDDIVLGRPYGGLAVMWRKHLTSKVKPVSFDDDRIIGVECVVNSTKMFLLGVYLPCNSNTNFEDFLFSLGKIRTIIDEFDSLYVYVFGDFNADIEKQSVFGNELVSFCHDSDLIVADPLFLSSGSVTHFNDGHGTESWLDHVVCTKGAVNLISDIVIDCAVCGSDHFPIVTTIPVPCCTAPVTSNQEAEIAKWTVDWSSIDKARLNMYTLGV